MALLPAAIIASDRALLFDNSATIGSVGEVIAARPAAEWIAGTLTLMPSEQPQPSWLDYLSPISKSMLKAQVQK